MAAARSNADSLKPLRAFCQVARLGSISRAARQLKLSQPAVTIQIQRLEAQLGIELFDRSARQISLNGAGELLFELARPLLDQFDSLAGVLSHRLQADSEAPVRIGADLCGRQVLAYLDPPRPLDLRAEMAAPGATLATTELDYWLGLKLAENSLQFEPLETWEWLLVAPENHPLCARANCNPANLHGHTRIRLAHEDPVSQALERALAAHTNIVCPTVAANDIGNTLLLLRQHQAYAILPKPLLQRECLHQLKLSTLQPCLPPARIGLSYSTQGAAHPGHAALIAALRKASSRRAKTG